MSERKLLQDMIPSPRKKVLRVPARHVEPSAPAAAVPPVHHIPKSMPVILERPARASRRGRPMRRHPLFITLIVIVCLAIIAVSVFFVTAQATVVIVPKRQAVTVNNTFTACKDAPCSATSALTYEVIEIPVAELHQTIPATEGALIQTKSQGTIVMYNSNPVAQIIPLGSRLTNTVGRVYTTAKAVTIPSAKKGLLGSIAVVVVASAPGSDYNIVPTDLTGDFKVADYKGTPKYTTIYGRLSPNAIISGGVSGRERIVASSTLNATYENLQKRLTAQVFSEAQALVPQDYIMYDNAHTLRFSLLSPVASSSTSVDVGVRAIFSGIMFKKNDLVKVAAQSAAPSIVLDTAFPHTAFTIEGLSNLTFKIASATTTLSTTTGLVSFKLNGSFTLVGTYPANDIILKLIGKDMAQSNAIFASYSTIASARATITPFWRHTFPDTPNKITITTQ